jgi:hypothetical protein
MGLWDNVGSDETLPVGETGADCTKSSLPSGRSTTVSVTAFPTCANSDSSSLRALKVETRAPVSSGMTEHKAREREARVAAQKSMTF